MDYPDKGVMGLAKRNPGGQLRLGLSATAGSAVLYGAIVVFGIGSASPSALDVDRDPHASVLLVSQHADTVPGSVRKLPQASPEPGRHRSPVRTHRHPTEVGSKLSPAQTTVERPSPQPAAPRVTEPRSPSVSGSSSAPVAAPQPSIAVPTLPAPELPVALPALPPLPVSPALPLPLPPGLPLDLPG
jgi:hypothetical protein